MAASKEDISIWFDEAKEEGATHMLVVMDNYEFDDCPVSVMPGYDVDFIIRDCRDEGETVMEVYDLRLPKLPQMNEIRAWNL